MADERDTEIQWFRDRLALVEDAYVEAERASGLEAHASGCGPGHSAESCGDDRAAEAYRWLASLPPRPQPGAPADSPPTITTVYRWQNDMVMVFDQDGQQMPTYQGPIDDVREKIRADAPASTQWWIGAWRGEIQRTDRATVLGGPPDA